MVMLLHAHFQLGKGGAIGVDIFFVLSGFLITKNLLDDYASNGYISMKKFWFKRFFRLFPPFFVLLISIFILSFFIEDVKLKNAILIEIRDSFLYLSIYEI
jgi:peptidoglycan/LPS O-acetylase OafA/YrhL